MDLHFILCFKELFGIGLNWHEYYGMAISPQL